MKTKYEPCIRLIARYLSERKYKLARQHIKRIWDKMDDMTDTEEEVLRLQAMKAFSKM